MYGMSAWARGFLVAVPPPRHRCCWWRLLMSCRQHAKMLGFGLCTLAVAGARQS